MNSDDRKRLDDLRNVAELRDLEIRTTPVEDLTTLFEGAELTVGQVLVIEELIAAYESLQNASVRSALQKANETDPLTSAEKRTGGRLSIPFNGFSPTEENDPFGVTDGQADEEAGRADRMKNLLFGGPDGNRMIDTVNGMIPLSEVPRDANGSIPDWWVRENCKCPDHTSKRERTEDNDPFSLLLSLLR